MLLRMEEQDPFWPIDGLTLEPPTQVFLDIYARSERVSTWVAEGCQSLLREAVAAPRAERWHCHLLELVHILRLENCRALLRQEVLRVGCAEHYTKRDADWLEAAAGFDWARDDEALRAWGQLLKRADTAVIAFTALTQGEGIAKWPEHIAWFLTYVDATYRPSLLKGFLTMLRRRQDVLSFNRGLNQIPAQRARDAVSEALRAIDGEREEHREKIAAVHGGLDAKRLQGESRTARRQFQKLKTALRKN